MFYQTFRKVRINTRKEKDEASDLLEKRRILKSRKDAIGLKKLEEVENKLVKLTARKNSEKIEEELNKLKNGKGDVDLNNFWKLKQKLFPKARDVSGAKYDAKGHLVSSGEKIKKLYLETYKERLKHKKIKEGLEEYQKMREELFELRRGEVKDKIKQPWTMEQLENVLKSLKKGKARDPLNLVNEIFRPEVAGSDLKQALLKIANKVNQEQTFPELLKYTDITSVYKGKGVKSDMDNQRGLFSMVSIRAIIDKLIYQDEYENIDKNLTDCNVGARKDRNIRDNLFVVNSVINAVVNGDDEPMPLMWSCLTSYNILTIFG